MTAYSTSTPSVVGTSNTGTIVVTISTTEGGGDPINYDVDLVVAVQSSSYNFTGGTPAASSTFGNNGARWEHITFSSGATLNRTYNWSRSTSVTSDYVVMLLTEAGPFHTHWGTIVGASTP